LKAPTTIQFFFSLMQFFATAVTLVGFRRSSIYFCLLFK
jgi:hypothetical protein